MSRSGFDRKLCGIAVMSKGRNADHALVECTVEGLAPFDALISTSEIECMHTFFQFFVDST